MESPTGTGPRLAAAAAETVVVLDAADLPHGLLDLRHRAAEVLRRGSRRLVVDVSRVERLSSTTVAALLLAHRACRARGGGLVLRAPSVATLDLLERTGLGDVMTVEGAPPRRRLGDLLTRRTPDAVPGPGTRTIQER